MTTTTMISNNTSEATEAQCYTVVLDSDTLHPGSTFVDCDSHSEGSVAVGYLTERGVEKVKAKLVELGFTSEWTPIGDARGYYYTPAYFIQLVVDGLKETAAHTDSNPMTITSNDLVKGGVELADGTYLYHGNPITWYGYKVGVLDLETVDGTFSLVLPCTLFKR